MGSEARREIEALIPHRAPFLFVDRVVERGADRILTEWCLPPEADYLRGHYPGNPLLPGVIATEFCLQSAALLLADPGAGWLERGSLPVLARLSDARFRRVVRPGETIRAEVRLLERVGPACYMKAEVHSADGERVLGLRFVLSVTATEALTHSQGLAP